MGILLTEGVRVLTALVTSGLQTRVLRRVTPGPRPRVCRVSPAPITEASGIDKWRMLLRTHRAGRWLWISRDRETSTQHRLLRAQGGKRVLIHWG